VFLQELATQSLSPNTSGQLISLESRLGLLRYLEESVRSLFVSSCKVSGDSGLRRNLTAYTEGLDFLLDRMLEAMAPKDRDAVAAFTKLTESRSEMLDGVRNEYLASKADSTAPERAALFEVAHGFEQTTWLLHRFALLLPQA